MPLSRPSVAFARDRAMVHPSGANACNPGGFLQPRAPHGEFRAAREGMDLLVIAASISEKNCRKIARGSEWRTSLGGFSIIVAIG